MLQVALPLCTPADSKKSATIAEDCRILAIYNVLVLQAIVTFIARPFLIENCLRVLCVLNDVLGKILLILVPTAGSARVHDVEIVTYNRNNAKPTVFSGMITILGD